MCCLDIIRILFINIVTDSLFMQLVFSNPIFYNIPSAPPLNPPPGLHRVIHHRRPSDQLQCHSVANLCKDEPRVDFSLR